MIKLYKSQKSTGWVQSTYLLKHINSLILTHIPIFLNIFTAIIINGSGEGDEGDCGGVRGRVGVGTDGRHFYLTF